MHLQAGSCTLDDIEFTVNDHSVVANYNTGNNGCTVPQFKIPGEAVPHEVLEFHLHTGSDHAVDGRFFAACMHLVHKEVGGSKLSILGFFLEPTSDDGIPELSDLLTKWENVSAGTQQICDARAGSTETGSVEQSGGERRAVYKQNDRRLSRQFNPYDLVPDGASMYQYQGSLTTPPCSEIVVWNVIDTPVSISVLQYLRLVHLIVDWVDPATCEKATAASVSGFTGRPVQAINGRQVERICSSSFPRGEEENDNSATTSAACFSAHNTVTLETGKIVPIQSLVIGDKVLVHGGTYESVYSFGYRNPDASTNYLRLATKGTALELTADHMLLIGETFVPASTVQIGDLLSNGETVSSITTVTRKGLYAPFTTTGTVVVSDIVSSSFVTLQKDTAYLMLGTSITLPMISWQWMCHSFEAPHRFLANLGFSETYNKDGISMWVVAPKIGMDWILDQHVVIMSIVLIPTVVVIAVMSLLLGESWFVVGMMLSVPIAKRDGKKTA